MPTEEENSTTKKPSAFEIAAKELRVSVGVLKVWLMEHVDPSPALWSHWKHNRQPIPPKDLLEFVKDRMRAAGPDASLVEKATATLSSLSHLGDDLREGIQEHLSRQVELLIALGQKIDQLSTGATSTGQPATTTHPPPKVAARGRR